MTDYYQIYQKVLFYKIFVSLSTDPNILHNACYKEANDYFISSEDVIVKLMSISLRVAVVIHVGLVGIFPIFCALLSHLHCLVCKFILLNTSKELHYRNARDRRDHDRMVVGFMTTFAISVYHHNVVS